MVNVYDFDNTIYDGDSSVNFIIFLVKKKFSLFFLIKCGIAFMGYILKFHPKEKAKETFFSILTKFDHPEELVEEFWSVNIDKIKPFYRNQKRNDDIIISASPEFLIQPICEKLQIRCMASKIDIHTGKYNGINCHGEEKVRRYYEIYNEEINEFYSDSLTDTPLAKEAKKAYLVKGQKITDWPNL